MSAGQKVVKYVAMAFAIMLSVGIITICAGAALSIIGGVAMIDGFDWEFTNEERVSFTKEFNPDEVRNLEINNYSGNMTIKPGDTFRVEANNVPERYIAEIRSGETLYLGYNSNNTPWFVFNFSLSDEDETSIIVTVPQDFVAEIITLDSSSGSLMVDTLRAKTISVNLGSGGSSYKNMEAEYLSIDSASGSVTLNECKSDYFTMDSASGTVRLSDCDLGEFETSSSSGSVTMEQIVVNNFNLDSASGRVLFKDGSIEGDITIESSSGSVTIDAKGNLGDYSIDTDASSGGIWINGERRDEYEHNPKAAKYKMIIDSGSGRVSVDLN